MYLQIPTDFSLDKESLKSIQAYGAFGFMRTLPFEIRPQNLIEIKDACLNFINANHLKAKLRINYLINPSTVRDTEPFAIQILDLNGNTLAVSDSGDTANSATIKASAFAPTKLTKTLFWAENAVVQEQTSLMMKLEGLD